MKFTTSFLAVLASTATLAAPSTDTCEGIIEKKYLNCNSVATSAYSANYCNEIFETEFCQKYFNSTLKEIYAEIPQCQSLVNSIDEKTSIDFELIRHTVKVSCAKDQQGNFCRYNPANPQSANETRGMSRMAKEIYIGKLVKESCKSKKCADEYLKYTEVKLQYYSLRNDLNGYELDDLEQK